MSANFQTAQNFMWSNARIIDRHRFAYHFTHGAAQPVIDSLKPYQNADGGFGHGLEPDNRSPESQPIAVETALKILDEVQAVDSVRDEMIPGIFDFLQSITTAEGGIPFTLPSANAYPHAPWWESPDHPPASLNPTGSIAGLLLKHRVRHPWLDRAVEYCWQAIENSESEMFYDLMPALTFLEHAPDPERAQRELARIAERLRRPGVVEMDPAAGGHVQMPLDWAPFPSSFCRHLFSETSLSQHLAALAGRQQPDGSWAINWDPISAGVELEWRGVLTIQALRTLQAYQGVGLVNAAAGT